MGQYLMTNGNSNFDSTFLRCIDPVTWQTWTVQSMVTERFRAWTPSEAAELKWVVVWLYSPNASTTIIENTYVYLQENVSWTRTDRATATLTYNTEFYAYWVFVRYFEFDTPYTVTTDASKWRLRFYSTGSGSPLSLLVSSTGTPFSILVTTDTDTFTDWDAIIVSNWDTFDLNKDATITAPIACEWNTSFGYSMIMCKDSLVKKEEWGAVKLLTQGSILNWADSIFRIWTSTTPITRANKFELEIDRFPWSALTYSRLFYVSTSATSNYVRSWVVEFYWEEWYEPYYTLTSDANASQKDLVLDWTPTTWVAWDHIRIDLNDTVSQWDITRHTIASQLSNTITTTSNLTVKRLTWARVENFSVRWIRIYPTSWRIYCYSSVWTFSNFVFKWCWAYNIIFAEWTTSQTYVINSDRWYTNRTIDIQNNAIEAGSTSIYYFMSCAKPDQTMYFKNNVLFRCNWFQTITSIYTPTFKAWYIEYENNRRISPYVAEFYTTLTLNKARIKNNRICNMGTSTTIWATSCNFLNSTIDWDYYYWLARPALWLRTCNWLTITNNVYERCNYLYLLDWTVINTQDIEPTIIDLWVTWPLFTALAYTALIVKSPTAEVVYSSTISEAIAWTYIAITNDWWITNNDKFYTTTGNIVRCWTSLADTTVYWTDNYSMRFNAWAWTLEYIVNSPTGDIQWESKLVSVRCKINSENYWAGEYVLPKLILIYDDWTELPCTAAQVLDWQKLFVPLETTTGSPLVKIKIATETDASDADWYVYRWHFDWSIPTPRNLDNRVDALPILDVWFLTTNASVVKDAVMNTDLSLYNTDWTFAKWVKIINQWVQKASKLIPHWTNI